MVHEACKYSQVNVVRFGIDVLGITFRDTIKVKGKVPVCQALRAHGYSAFQYLMKTRKDRIELVSGWHQVVEEAMESQPQALINLVKARSIRRWSPDDPYRMGVKLLLGALWQNVGFDSALNGLMRYEWTRRCIGEALYGGPAWPWPREMKHHIWNSCVFDRSKWYGRRNFRAVLSLLERGWLDPSALGPAQSHLPVFDFVQAAARHGHAPDKQDAIFALRKRVEDSCDFVWTKFFRKFRQFGKVSSIMDGLKLLSPAEPSSPRAPVVACLLHALVLRKPGPWDPPGANVSVLNDLVPVRKARALSFQVTGAQVQKCALLFGVQLSVSWTE